MNKHMKLEPLVQPLTSAAASCESVEARSTLQRFNSSTIRVFSTATSRRTLLGALAALVLGLALAVPAWAAPSEFERTYAEFQKPDGKHVLVAAHRGLTGISTGAWQKHPENSLAAIAHSIELGVDIVEVDVRKTKDGHLILMHDATVDRTTDGTGSITNLTLADMKKLRLKLGVGGPNAGLTNERVPTLEEVMLLVKDKCMVNLDKGATLVTECYAVLKKTGTIRQGIFKSSYNAERCQKDFAHLDPPVNFMPIVLNKKGWEKKKEQGWAQLEPYLHLTRPCAVELVFVSDDDPVVAPETLAKLKRNGARPWINTLWDDLAAGHTDAKSLTDPAAGWGWVIARGANVIQTDEAERLLEYLRARKLHW